MNVVSMVKPVQPARTPLHESFYTDLGTVARNNHAQGKHARVRSLVCADCRTETGR